LRRWDAGRRAASESLDRLARQAPGKAKERLDAGSFIMGIHPSGRRPISRESYFYNDREHHE
jgi:hypothetical protein